MNFKKKITNEKKNNIDISTIETSVSKLILDATNILTDYQAEIGVGCKLLDDALNKLSIAYGLAMIKEHNFKPRR